MNEDHRDRQMIGREPWRMPEMGLSFHVELPFQKPKDCLKALKEVRKEID